MTDITELMADKPIQNMARDLHRTNTPERYVTDRNGCPLLAFVCETSNEYYEERGGTLNATRGAIATAVLAVAYQSSDQQHQKRGA